MLSLDEQVRLDNFRAQYNSILGNIVVANGELEVVITNKESAVYELQCIERDVQAAKEDFESVKNRLKLLREDCQTSRDAKSATDNEIDTLVKTVGRLQSQVTKTESARAKQLEKIGQLSDRVSDLLLELDSSKKRVIIVKDEIKILESRLSEVREQYRLAKEASESELESLDRQITSTKSELADVKEKVRVEKDKVLDFDKHVAQRFKVLERRESDVIVLRNRLQKLYDKVMPGALVKM